jgi:PAS domain S-box-containing protein
MHLSPSHPTRGTILIVDDQMQNLRLLSAMLKEHGHQVRVVVSGDMALKSVQADAPDLILLDVNMPEMNGYEVCQRLKLNHLTRDIPIIFLSALDEVTNKVEAFSIGGVDYITKPFRIEEVLARVETQLVIKRTREDLQKAYDELELRVRERTSELVQANLALQSEIAGRKMVEEALRQSEEQYRTLVETSPSAILLTDTSGTIRFCNQQAAMLFGFARANELRGKNSLDLIAPDAEGEQQTVSPQTIIRTENTRNIEYILQKVDGSRFPAEISSSVVTNQQQEPVALIIVVQDISERTLLQTHVIENERFAAGGRLAASVAHEINTPLQTIQTNLRLLATGCTDEETTLFLNDAMEEIKRIGRIVRQLLDLYRPATATYGPVDISSLLGRILLLIGKQVRDQRVLVESDLPVDLPYICGRTDELMQVFLNLLVNALDAMPDGGTLRVWAALREPQKADTAYPSPSARLAIVVGVGDTGCGIAPELQSRIFAPFITTKRDGTGLGLSISSEIIQQHGGRIDLESQPGIGSTFFVMLPVFWG